MNNGVKFVVALLVTVFVLVPVLLRVVLNFGNSQGVRWDRPFSDDPAVVGAWKTVDYVRNMDDFVPGQKQWPGDLFLKDLTFMPDGNTSDKLKWTRGYIWYGDGVEGQYTVKEVGGGTYLFIEWMNGDVAAGRQKPSYYVLERKA